MTTTPAAVTRFLERARARGLDPQVRTFPDGTRTAAEAAAAVGCDVAQIVKSLVFVAVYPDRRPTTAAGPSAQDAAAGPAKPTTEQPVLVLTSGANRVDTAAVASALGADRLRKADAARVRSATGYAIGGTPPVGHDTDLLVVCDRALLDHDVVWAAAGTPTTVFDVSPATLLEATGARIVDVAG